MHPLQIKIAAKIDKILKELDPPVGKWLAREYRSWRAVARRILEEEPMLATKLPALRYYMLRSTPNFFKTISKEEKFKQYARLFGYDEYLSQLGIRAEVIKDLIKENKPIVKKLLKISSPRFLF